MSMDTNNEFTCDKMGNRDKICEHFKSFIPSGVLIKLIEEIENDKRFDEVKQKVYPYGIGDYGQSTENDIEYDVSNIVAMSYSYYTTILKYSCDISMPEVNEQISKKIIETYFYEADFKFCLSAPEKVSQNSAIPIIFTMLGLARILIGLLEKHKKQFGKVENDYDSLFKYNSIVGSLEFCQSTLNNLVFGDIPSAKSSLRTLIETYFTWYAIKDNHEAIIVYYKNMWCKICRLEHRSLDKEQSKNQGVPKCPSANKLGYGWLIFLVKDQKKGNLSFRDVFDFCFPKRPNIAQEWNNVYQACSNNAHGNQLYYEEKFLGFYDVSIPLATVLLSTYKDFSYYVNLSSYENAALDFFVDKLKKEIAELKKMMQPSKIIWMCDINKIKID